MVNNEHFSGSNDTSCVHGESLRDVSSESVLEGRAHAERRCKFIFPNSCEDLDGVFHSVVMVWKGPI